MPCVLQQLVNKYLKFFRHLFVLKFCLVCEISNKFIGIFCCCCCCLRNSQAEAMRCFVVCLFEHFNRLAKQLQSNLICRRLAERTPAPVHMAYEQCGLFIATRAPQRAAHIKCTVLIVKAHTHTRAVGIIISTYTQANTHRVKKENDENRWENCS